MTQGILLLFLTMYLLLVHHFLPWTYVCLPLLVVVQAIAMVGVSYILSSLGVYLRDIKDIVIVFNIVGLYLMPAFYLPEFVPESLRPILYLNPFSYLIWCYQDAIYFGRFEHWWAWIVWGIFSAGVCIMGYRLFRKLKIMFENVL
jgi:lipopolysaccharide transport system permease protein